MTTKERIIQASIDLFAQKGYTETSIKEIAQACDIKAASIYNHFESKSQIINFILQEYIDYTSRNTLTEDSISAMIQTEDPATMLMRMFYRYGSANSKRYASILKIILHEHLRNEEIGAFFVEHFIQRNEQRLNFLLTELTRQKRIAPVNHPYYAKILNSIALAMSLEYSHFTKIPSYKDENRIIMDDILAFVIDKIIHDKGHKGETAPPKEFQRLHSVDDTKE